MTSIRKPKKRQVIEADELHVKGCKGEREVPRKPDVCAE